MKRLLLIMAGILGLAAFGMFSKKTVEAHETMQHSSSTLPTSYENELRTWLKSEEEKVWAMLAQHGLTREIFAQEAERLKEVHKKDCLDTRLDFGGCTDTVDPKIKELIQKIANKLGIDISHVEILSYWGKSPMAAVDYLFLVHPDFVKSYSQEVLESTIAHELQHIKNKDNLWTFIADRYLPEAGREAPNHPFNYLRRFKELRADMGAILGGYGEGHYKEYAGLVHSGKKTPGVTHPTNEQRFLVSKAFQEKTIPSIQLA